MHASLLRNREGPGLLPRKKLQVGGRRREEERGGGTEGGGREMEGSERGWKGREGGGGEEEGIGGEKEVKVRRGDKEEWGAKDCGGRGESLPTLQTMIFGL